MAIPKRPASRDSMDLPPEVDGENGAQLQRFLDDVAFLGIGILAVSATGAVQCVPPEQVQMVCAECPEPSDTPYDVWCAGVDALLAEWAQREERGHDPL